MWAIEELECFLFTAGSNVRETTQKFSLGNQLLGNSKRENIGGHDFNSAEKKNDSNANSQTALANSGCSQGPQKIAKCPVTYSNSFIAKTLGFWYVDRADKGSEKCFHC